MRIFRIALLLGGLMTLAASDDVNAQPTDAPSADARAVRAARAAQNDAIVAGDLEAVTAFWTEDVTVRRALGSPVAGRAAARAAFEPPAGTPPAGSATTPPRIVYQRIPSEVQVSTQWPLAFESGVWEGREGTANGPIIIGGKFSAQWVKRDGRWLIRSEVFVAWPCHNSGMLRFALRRSHEW
jgi:ketosteroid isomerase-like protein